MKAVVSFRMIDTDDQPVRDARCGRTEQDFLTACQPIFIIAEEGLLKPGSIVDVVLAYANTMVLSAAIDVYYTIVRKLCLDCRFRDSLWSLGTLAHPQFLEYNAQAAATADIIFCCLGHRVWLPPVVEEWLGLWLRRRTLPDRVLVAMLRAPYGTLDEPDGAANALQNAARARGLDFFTATYPVGSRAEPEWVPSAETGAPNGEPPGNELVDSGLSPAESLQRAEWLATLDAGLESLPAKLRKPLEAFVFDDRAQADIAAELGSSAKAVEMCLYHARQRLRHFLQASAKYPEGLRLPKRSTRKKVAPCSTERRPTH